MDLNPVIAMLGRRLRLAVVGGGPGSFIGAMHRQAARLDDRYEIVTGILPPISRNRTKQRWKLALPPTVYIQASTKCLIKSHPAVTAWM